ncbi:MAG TPA: chloride channel protein [Bacillota bacterium]|nr:chloride channel protein [Bacillota bacterium]
MFRLNYIEPFVMLATLFRWLFLATLTGIIVGTGTSLFLRALFFSIDQTTQIPLWLQLLLLPLGGILNGLLIYYGYQKKKPGLEDSVIAAVHKQEGELPLKTAPIKPFAAIITLATGGSAGKEGPCSHIGGTLASWLGRLMRLRPTLQKKIVACGVSAGFASVFGTPIAGAIYAVEVLTIGRIRHDYLFSSVIAGITSYQISQFWGISYTFYPYDMVADFSELFFLKIVVLGIICGLVSLLFIEIFEEVRMFFSYIQQRFRIYRPLMPLIGGVVLSILILFIPIDYLGLSLLIMDKALSGESIPFFAFFWKALLVAITLGSGFYGGIVTPQFVIGALTGNAFASLFSIDPALGARVGMVAVVAAASNTPIAAVFMGFELFGASVGIYVIGACLAAYIVIGHRSVYPDQLIVFAKSIWIQAKRGSALNEQDVQISYDLLRKIQRWQRWEANKHGPLKPPDKK